DIVKSTCAGFRCQIHLESCRCQHLVRMQGLHEEDACLVATGIDGTVKAGNCDKGLAWNFIRHDFLLYFWSPFLPAPNFFLFANWRTSSPPFPRCHRPAAG